MGERKVLNKYIPPDFDPSIIPKMKRDRSKLIEVRMMLPFSLRCCTCNEYMYKGKKFNSKKEDVVGDDYMGIRKYRFLIKCTVCSAEIAFKTDPKNSDYECEWGATRNFEMWRDNDTVQQDENKAREEEEKLDVMKSLENRTIDSKIEMDVLDALDEIKAINQRHERVDTDAILQLAHIKNEMKILTQTDEELIKSINFKSKINNNNSDIIDTYLSSSSNSTSSSNSITDVIQKQIQSTLNNSNSTSSSIHGNSNSSVVIIKKKRKTDNTLPTIEESSQSNKIPKITKTNIASTSTSATSTTTSLDTIKNVEVVNPKINSTSTSSLNVLGGLVGYGGGSSSEEEGGQ